MTGTASNITLGGGNTQTWTGGFTRTSGLTGVVCVADLAGSLMLVANNFYWKFTDDPATTAAALTLPQMRGSGMVRDLRPAMSLGNAQATALQAAMAQFGAGTTRDLQRASLDAVIQSWGATNAMQTSVVANRTLVWALNGGPDTAPAPAIG